MSESGQGQQAPQWTYKAGIVGRDGCGMFIAGPLNEGVVNAFLDELNSLQAALDDAHRSYKKEIDVLQAALTVANERADQWQQRAADEALAGLANGRARHKLEADLVLLRPRAAMAEERAKTLRRYQLITDLGSLDARWLNRYDALPAAPVQADVPIPMLLDCPICGQNHIDEGVWVAKPHKTHLCAGCGHEWRPANVPTVGVYALEPAAGGQP